MNVLSQCLTKIYLDNYIGECRFLMSAHGMRAWRRII